MDGDHPAGGTAGVDTRLPATSQRPRRRNGYDRAYIRLEGASGALNRDDDAASKTQLTIIIALHWFWNVTPLVVEGKEQIFVHQPVMLRVGALPVGDIWYRLMLTVCK